MKNTFILTDGIPHINEQICKLFNVPNLATNKARHYIFDKACLLWGSEDDVKELYNISKLHYNNAPIIHYTELPMFSPKLKRI